MSKKVYLTVQTMSGMFEGEFDSDQKIQEVIDKVFISLDIKPAPGDDYKLRLGETVLDPQTTIEQNNLPDGATLTLAPKEGGGGSRGTGQ